MKFEDAREHVIAAVHSATGSLNQSGVWTKLANGEDVPFSEMEIDSLAAMQMCLDIEEKTGLEIDLAELAQHPSINTLANFIVAKVQPG